MKIKEYKNKIERENPEVVSLVNNDLAYQIGKRIELARGLKNITQHELARKIGTRQSSISRIESGSSLPSLSFLLKIAEAFETTLTVPEFTFMKSYAETKLTYKAENSATTPIPSPYAASMNITKKISF